MAINLPDFDDLMDLVNEIQFLTMKKMKLDVQIKKAESDSVYQVLTVEKFKVNGRKPTTPLVSALAYTGINGEIIPLREIYAETCADLEKKKMIYELSRDKIQVWRTQAANERLSLQT